MQLDMKNPKLLSICFAFMFFSGLSAQIDVVQHLIINNDSDIRELIMAKPNKAVIIFCPTAYISRDTYNKKAEELIRSYKLKGISDLSIHFIYFKQDTKNNSKGVKYVSHDKKDTSFIGQFECFFSGFDSVLLARAKSKMKYNYDLIRVFGNETLFSIPIVDTNKCFEKMQDRIPFYADFIRESILPMYSVDEKMQFMRDTINTLSSLVFEMKQQIESMKLVYDREIEEIKQKQSSGLDNQSDKKEKNKPQKNPIDKPKELNIINE